MTIFLGIEYVDTTVEALANRALGDGAGLIVTANLDHLATLQRDKCFREAYRSADTRTIDGAPLLALCRLSGAKNSSRVPGSNLAKAVFDRLDPAKHRPLLIASDPATAAAALQLLESRGFLADNTKAIVPPFGFQDNLAQSDSLRVAIGLFAPTHVFFGLGAPKSEIWSSRNRQCFGQATILCVGSGLNMAVGTLRRSPQWMQILGVEWLWRFLQEPSRLGPRYIRNAWRLPSFVLVAIKVRMERPVESLI